MRLQDMKHENKKPANVVVVAYQDEGELFGWDGGGFYFHAR